MGTEPTIRNIYPEQWTLVRQHLAFAADDAFDDMCESFLFNAMPRLKGVRDPSTFFRIIKDELLYQLGQDRLPPTQVIQRFSEHLLDLNRNSEADSISEKWNHRFRIVGYILIAVNLAYALLLFLVSSGYSMGPFFMLLGLLIWLTPSFLGYYAIRRKPESFFGTWEGVLLFTATALVVLFGYWLFNDISELFTHTADDGLRQY